jgi:hypothetical protein
VKEVTEVEKFSRLKSSLGNMMLQVGIPHVGGGESQKSA